MSDVNHLALAELEAGLLAISGSPQDAGNVALIVRRPDVGAREALSQARLDPQTGLEGDNWLLRLKAAAAGSAPPTDRQLTLMNARVISLLAQSRQRWALAGDQLYLDFDLSVANAPIGTRLKIGAAMVEITAPPHTGCAKFAARFGRDALLFVNAPAYKELRLRGVNARVIQAGDIKTGDVVSKA